MLLAAPGANEEQMRIREAAAPLAKLLWVGCIKGSEGRPRF
jgi:hypothetical protein